MCVANYSREDIVKWMELLRTQIHDTPSVRFRKLWHTEFPSIQGPWTPFTFKDPKLNLEHYPNVINIFMTRSSLILKFVFKHLSIVVMCYVLFPFCRRHLVRLLNLVPRLRKNSLNYSKLSNWTQQINHQMIRTNRQINKTHMYKMHNFFDTL